MSLRREKLNSLILVIHENVQRDVGGVVPPMITVIDLLDEEEKKYIVDTLIKIGHKASLISKMWDNSVKKIPIIRNSTSLSVQWGNFKPRLGGGILSSTEIFTPDERQELDTAQMHFKIAALQDGQIWIITSFVSDSAISSFINAIRKPKHPKPSKHLKETDSKVGAVVSPKYEKFQYKSEDFPPL